MAFRAAGPRAWSRHYATTNGEEGSRTQDDGPSEKDNAQASGSSEQPSSEQPPAESEAEKKLKAKEQEVVDLTGRLRYLQADFVNLQRNAAREKEQTRDFAITKFAGDLLETVDVLSYAMKSVPESALKPAQSSSPSSDPETSSPSSDSSSPPPTKSALEYLNQLHEGVDATHRQLLQTLFKYNVKPFDPTGDKFDPNRHEALLQVPVPDKVPGTVLECAKIGYTIKDRTLRAAQVVVVADSQR